MVALIPLSYIILFLIVYERLRDIRRSIATTFVVYGAAVVATTELLGLFRALTATGLAMVHIAFILAGVWSLSRKRLQIRSYRSGIMTHAAALMRSTFESRVILASTGFIIVVVFITAVLSPPNTPDVHVYHLPRVLKWLQHGAVTHYPVISTLELSMPPFHEFLVMHVHALTGGDRFDSVVTVYSYALSIVAASLIVRQFGGSAITQVLAAFLVASLPQGVLSASGGKNDWTTSATLMVAIFFLYDAVQKRSMAGAAMFGLSAALALLTKGTAYIFLAGIGAALVLLYPEARRLIFRTRALVVITLIIVAVNVPYWVRNNNTFGSPLGPSTAVPNACPFANSSIGPPALVSNLVRNISLHLATVSPELNERLVTTARNSLGWFDIDPDDPATSWCGMTKFSVSANILNEDFAANTLHFLLIVGSLAVLVRRDMEREYKFLLLGVLLGFLLFCAYLVWQPWHTRLHLPLFAISGIVISRAVVAGDRSAVWIVFLLTFATALPAVLANQLRPLLPLSKLNLLQSSRSDLYFTASTSQTAFTKAAEYVNQSDCYDIGLNHYGHAVIYPFLQMIQVGAGSRRVREVGVLNSTVSLDEPDPFIPCMVVCMACAHREDLRNQFEQDFSLKTTFETVGIFEPRRTTQ